jgi:hypothetical protein
MGFFEGLYDLAAAQREYIRQWSNTPRIIDPLYRSPGVSTPDYGAQVANVNAMDAISEIAKPTFTLGGMGLLIGAYQLAFVTERPKPHLRVYPTSLRQQLANQLKSEFAVLKKPTLFWGMSSQHFWESEGSLCMRGRIQG